MRQIFMICFAIFGIAVQAVAQHVERTDRGVKTSIQSAVVELSFYSPEIVRVVKYPKGETFAKESFSVIAKPEPVKVNIEQTGEIVKVSSDAMQVTLNLKTGKITYLSTDGKLLLTEKDYSSNLFPTQYNDNQAETAAYYDEKSLFIRQAFMLDSDEAIYGLGQHQNGRMNQRNQQITLCQDNGKIAIPYIQSTKGYGLFWDNYSPTTFLDVPQEMAFESQDGDGVDYYFMYDGGSQNRVLALMGKLTGRAPMNSLWTYGFHQSKERYRSQEEIVSVVKKYRELGVPLDGIIQDWQYWGTDNAYWNSTEFGNPLFPDPKKMIDDIHTLNARITISVWPLFGPKTQIHKDLNSIGALLNINTWHNNGTRPYDPFNPKARDLYWNYLNKNMYAIGMDGWWLDATEPEFFDHENKKNQLTNAGSLRRVFNAYSLVSVGGVYENQRKTDSSKRVFILTRSAFAGQQRYAAGAWSGDVTASWDVLHRQIAAGVNFSVCGLPYWNTDIGGFFTGKFYPGGCKDVAYQELYTRWTQFGAFTSMMRSHGTNTPREIFNFGERGTWAFDAQERFIHLRYALLPYLYSTAWNITNNSDGYMRGLFLDFVEDKKVYDIDNEYMFGRTFLVAPVTEAMYVDENKNVDMSTVKSTDVYLPKGTMWYDFWTGQQFEGGQTVQKEVPIDIMPLYIRAGSIVPIGPKVQYSTEKKWNDMEIRVYPGADGTFTLYEDENDNYNYEKGVYSTITFNWNDAKRQLTIAGRQGSFPGMLKNRKFKVVLVNQNAGVGDEPLKSGKTVGYNGKQVSVKL